MKYLWLPLSLLLVSLPLLAADKDSEMLEVAVIGDPDQLRELLDSGAKVDAQTRFGKTALMFAIEDGNEEAAKLLLERGATVNVQTAAGCSPLTFAAEAGEVNLLRLLLARGGVCNQITNLP